MRPRFPLHIFCVRNIFYLMKTTIKSVKAREVLDSRGFPTIEVDLLLESGVMTRAAVANGYDEAPYGSVSVRDNDPDRYHGRGVLQAAKAINETIGPALIGKDTEAQEEIDQFLVDLDGTQNKRNLGANVILVLSLASARACAIAKNVPFYQHITRSDSATLLPVPLINILDGGHHADNNLDFQEFLIVPAGAPSFREALRYGAEVSFALKEVILDKGYHAGVGDEGGFAPDLQNHEEALKMLLAAIERAGFEPGSDIYLALDVAADNLVSNGRYTLQNENLVDAESSAVIDFYEGLVDRYPIISIEDGLAADDWEGWRSLSERLGHRLQLVGDHLFYSDLARLSLGIRRGIANSILVKPNQIGTLTEICRLIHEAREGGLTQIISHRHGETCDPFLASLAVACNTGQIKAGATCRSERLSKYNELLRIEQELGEQARWIGINAFPRGV